MVLDRFSYHHRTCLYECCQRMTVLVNEDKVLQQHVALLFQARLLLTIILQKNASPHTAKVFMNFIRVNYIAVQPWPLIPGQGADRTYRGRNWKTHTNSRFTSKPRDFLDRLIREQNQLPQSLFRKSDKSMQRHCNACISTNEGHTYY